MTQVHETTKRGRGRPINPDSLHRQMLQMQVSDEVALFVPAEHSPQNAVGATGCVIARSCGGGRRYTTKKADGGTWVWRIA